MFLVLTANIAIIILISAENGWMSYYGGVYVHVYVSLNAQMAADNAWRGGATRCDRCGLHQC